MRLNFKKAQALVKKSKGRKAFSLIGGKLFVVPTKSRTSKPFAHEVTDGHEMAMMLAEASKRAETMDLMNSEELIKQKEEETKKNGPERDT